LHHASGQVSIHHLMNAAAHKDVSLKIPSVKKERIDQALKQFDEKFCHTPE